jgi:hypothetical protein
LPSLALGTALVSGGFFIGIGFALVKQLGHSPAQVIFKQGETNMADKGKKDKSKREKQKKAQLNLKEKRKLKKEKKQKAPPPAVSE